MRFLKMEQNDKLEWLVHKDDYMHCSDLGCLEAYLAEGVIAQYANSIVDFRSERYIGCGYCIAGCPLDIPRFSPEDNRVYKCILCVSRVVVGQEPIYVKTYPTGAIHFGTKESIKTLASERVTELRTHDYNSADLYDPTGVSGTYVIHVLHHADEPSLYYDLPENPEVSETVKFWEDIWKPLTAVGSAATFAASISHYMGVGPNCVDEEENSLHEEKDEECK